jgi:hypothetical protein
MATYLLCSVGMFFNIPMGANCAPLLTDLFLYAYETDLIQGFVRKSEKNLTLSFNFEFSGLLYIYNLNFQ